MEDIYSNPIVIKIHQGTTREDKNLCTSCRNSLVRRGAATGRLVVICRIDNPTYMREPIAECSSYSNKSEPSLHDMREIAWTLMTNKGGKSIGFERPKRDNNDFGVPQQVPGFGG